MYHIYHKLKWYIFFHFFHNFDKRSIYKHLITQWEMAFNSMSNWHRFDIELAIISHWKELVDIFCSQVLSTQTRVNKFFFIFSIFRFLSRAKPLPPHFLIFFHFIKFDMITLIGRWTRYRVKIYSYSNVIKEWRR